MSSSKANTSDQALRSALAAAGLPRSRVARAWRIDGRLGRNLSLGLLVLFLAFLSLYPLAMLFYGSIHSTPPGEPGAFNLSGYRDIVSAENLRVLANTIGIAAITSTISMVVAIGLAFVVARTDTPFARQFEVLITLPFFIPPILTAMAWAMLGNAKIGALNQFFKWATGTTVAPIDIYSYWGVVWHLMQYGIPFLFLLIVDAFRAMDPALEEAASVSGASRWRVFRGITLSLLLPVLAGAFVLSFIRGVEAFESALFFGTPAGVKVITTTIFDSITQRAKPEYQLATSLAFAIVGLMFLLVFVQWQILRGRSFQTVTGRGYQPRVMRLGAWRWATFALLCLFFFVTTILPVGQIALGSFFRYIGFYRLDSLTLEHYAATANNAELWRAVRNTLILGLTGATATMALGTIVGYVTIRTRWRYRKVVDGLAWLPWMMPGVVMGVGLLWSYAFLPRQIPIYGTIWALLFAYLALGMPISSRIMSGAFTQLSFDLEECSRVHGATFGQTLTRILVALAWPAFAVGWVLTFFGILRELSASILLYSVGSEVLSVELYKLWTNGQVEEVSVIGLMLVALVILFRWVQIRFLNRQISAM
jgi:iron(III) transport system permease protein